MNKKAKVTPEDTLLLIQRALVLLGSVSHTITLERRKIAWARINPKLKSLASEEYAEREWTRLLGEGLETDGSGEDTRQGVHSGEIRASAEKTEV
jgi:hypothetical protein